MLGSRLAQGTLAGYYGLFVQLLFQLISVPVLTFHWGLEGFGVWLMLFTVPGLLAMADLGLTTAGANAMIDAAARGERAQAARIHAALRAVTLAIAATLLALATLVLFALPPESLAFAAPFTSETTRSTAVLLTAYGALALVNGVTLAGYRAADMFALSGWHFHTVALAETVAALMVAIAGGEPIAVAAAFLTMRLAGSLLMTLALRRRAPWLSSWRAELAELRPLVRPALAALAYPGGNALAMQGAVLAIGTVGGPAAVPAYAVVRTLTRTALQFAFRFNIASMPRYTVFAAQDDRARKAQLIVLNLAVTFALVVPAALALFALGVPIVHWWTGGRVEAGMALLTVLVFAMLADSVWVPLSNLVMAINRHAGFTWFYLFAAALSIGAGAVLVREAGALGMAWAALALELAMIVRVWRLARQLGMIDPTELRAAVGALRGELRERGASAKDVHP